MLGDKDYKNCIKEVAGRSDVFIATVPDSPRAASGEDVAALAKEVCGDVSVEKDPYTAAKKAKSLANENDVVIACGSLYMIGEAKRAFEE